MNEEFYENSEPRKPSIISLQNNSQLESFLNMNDSAQILASLQHIEQLIYKNMSKNQQATQMQQVYDQNNSGIKLFQLDQSESMISDKKEDLSLSRIENQQQPLPIEKPASDNSYQQNDPKLKAGNQIMA